MYSFRRRRFRRRTWRGRRRQGRRYGRRYARKRYSYRRRGRTARKYGSKSLATYTFRSDLQVDLQPQNLTQEAGGITFGIYQSGDAQFLAGMYNRYRILKVTCKVKPKTPKYTSLDPLIAVADTPSNNIDRQDVPEIFLRRDYEDNNAPSGTLLAFRNAKGTFRVGFGNTKTFSIRPATQQFMYEGVLGTAYSPSWRRWISTDDPSCEYLGLKYVMPSINAYFDKAFFYNGGWTLEWWIKVQYRDWRRGTT